MQALWRTATKVQFFSGKIGGAGCYLHVLKLLTLPPLGALKLLSLHDRLLLPLSMTGVEIANRGQIRFVRKGPQACSVTLTISYEVPDVLAPFAEV